MGRFDLDIRGSPVTNVEIVEKLHCFNRDLVHLPRKTADRARVANS
jgi:hypothetical protein